MTETGASIQIDNGSYARLHNKILELLARVDLSSGEFRCVMFLLRSTYGWSKKSDVISYSQWADGTQMDRRSVIRSLNSLIDKRIVIGVSNGHNRPKTWSFNKYFEQWTTATSDRNDTKTSDRNDTSTSDRNVTSLAQTSDRNDTKTSDRNDTHKRKKETTTKDNSAIDGTAGNSGGGDLTLSDVYKVFENNIGLLQPMTSDMLADDVTEYGAQWVVDAIAIAVKNGKRNLSYVEGILRRWHADGRDDKPKAVAVAEGKLAGLVWEG